MSRAFVRERDQGPDERLPDRPISAHRNFIAASGPKQIQAQVYALEARRHEARARHDAPALARQGLLRWVSPLANAPMGAVPGDPLMILDRKCEVLRIEA